MSTRPFGPKSWPMLSAVGLGFAALASPQPARAQITVATQNLDNGRSGANAAETALTPANVNVNSFGKLFTISGLDAPVGGQVLLVPHVLFNGVSHNALYAYQVNDSDNSKCGLSAFDADTGTQLWHVGLPASAKYTTDTPVIDTAAGLLYLVTKSGTDDTGLTFLHAFSISTGAEQPGSPIQVAASATGTGDGAVAGQVSLDGIPTGGSSRFHANERPGLLLVNGTVYLAFAHNTDSFPYHGWVLAYKYDGAQFTQTAKFCTTPNGSDGGIWQSGKGLTADAQGNIYCSVGNGTFDANTKGISTGTDYGMCYLKLSPALQVLSWFSPHDEGGFSQSDLDTGNSGVVGIPGTTRLFGGATKFGTGFLLDSAGLGGFKMGPGGGDNVLLRLDGLSSSNNVGQNPVAWDAGGLKYVYLWPRTPNGGPNASLEQFAYDPGVATFSPSGVFKQNTGLTGGGLMAVSSLGGANGILWAVDSKNAIVHALPAADVSQPDLWNSAQNATRDGLGSVGKWQFPVVANGKVYVPTGGTTIAVYGLLPTTLAGVAGFQSVTGSLVQPLTLTFTPTGQTGGAAFTRTVTTAADGSFSLPSVPAGTYTLGVKGAKWLQKDVAVDTTGGPVSGLSVSLLGGDLNGDNVVDFNDFYILRGSFNAVGTNLPADLNGDGVVDFNDFYILRGNFNKAGDP